MISISISFSYAQAPRDYGDAPRVYDTNVDGDYRPARNANWDGLYMGNSEPDTELSKLEVNMDDDNNGLNGDGNDEDGVLVLPDITKRMDYSVIVKVSNHSDAARILRGWIDFNMNGKFEDTEVAEVSVPNSIDNGLFTLTWTCTQTDKIPNIASMTRKSLYMRLRISTSTNNYPGPSAALFDRRAFADGDNSTNYTRKEGEGPYLGEVEDYMVYVKEMEPFQCTDRTYQTDLNKFYSYTYTGLRFLEATFCGDINGIGYNVKDSFIWGFDRDSYRLVKIGSNQTIEYYVVPNLPTGLDLFVGDIDTNGYYYLSSGVGSPGYYTIDLNPERPNTYLKLVNPLKTIILLKHLVHGVLLT